MSWTDFYEAMADAVMAYSNRRSALYEKIRGMATDEPLLAYLHFDRHEYWSNRGFQIDPFTSMGIFNRNVSAAHREALCALMAKNFGVALAPPESFHGIPHLDPRRSIYSGNDALWSLALAAVAGDAGDAAFQKAFDAAMAGHGNALATLSMALFWMRPKKFMALDGMSMPYLEKTYQLAPPPSKCAGAEYAAYLLKLKKAANADFPAIALASWRAMNEDAR